MTLIYKYPVGHLIVAPIRKFLTAQSQGDNFVVWAEVDLSKPDKTYATFAAWTGEHIDNDAIYINTIQDGPIVNHIYAVELNEEQARKVRELEKKYADAYAE